jgi:hypothetical protein
MAEVAVSKITLSRPRGVRLSPTGAEEVQSHAGQRDSA